MDGNVGRAVDAIGRGRFAVVVDASDRENEADLVLAAEAMTTEKMAFLLRHTSGIVCAPMAEGRADELDLPLMVPDNDEPHRTAFTVTVDARDHTSTGVSAADRAATMRLLADPAARPSGFSRPGHVFPLRAHERGVLGRAGHTEASVELGRLAGVRPVMAICELTLHEGRMARAEDARAFAEQHDLPLVTVEELVRARGPVARAEHIEHIEHVEHVATVPLPTAYGQFSASLMLTEPAGLEHVVLTYGDVRPGGADPVLVRLHSECATGDLFGSLRCDCGEQLSESLRAITAAGAGVLIYVRGHEGRGIGLADKFRAYALQDAGADTVEANLRLGHPADSRDFTMAARVLRSLGIRNVELLTNNPRKVSALRASGLDVVPRPLRATPTTANVRYLHTKQHRLGHTLAVGAHDAGSVATTMDGS